MRETFHKRLDLLIEHLVRMSGLAATAMQDATTALLSGDLKLAEQIIDDDRIVDLGRSTCESDAHVLLALQAPVAADLRLVIAALHSAESLERMGDLAQHVAEAVRRRHPHQVLPPLLRPRFAEMGRIAVGLATTATECLRTRNAALADEVVATDRELDGLHRSLFAVLNYREWAYGVATAVDASQLSQFYERFGDHAVSIARRTTFIATGTMSRKAG
jgi:phosphate transport system protein